MGIDAILELRDVVAGYGEMTILNGTTFDVPRGAITTIIGPNGAGKSTVFKTVFGLLKARQGTIRLGGRDITNASPRRLLEAGICYIPQGRNIFPELSVRHNIELGGVAAGAGVKDLARRIEAARDRFPVLRRKADAQASTLSGGEQKQLEIGRALLLRPQVILIDEPSIGLSPMVVQDVFKLLRKLADQGTTVLMVEQNVKSALKISDDAIALESGRLALHKPAAELLADPNIERLFLGGHAPAPSAEPTAA